MGGPARPLHEPGNHRSSERCSHRHSADRGSLIGQPTLLRITAPTPRPGARSVGLAVVAPTMITLLYVGYADSLFRLTRFLPAPAIPGAKYADHFHRAHAGGLRSRANP